MIVNVKWAIHGTYHFIRSNNLPRYLAKFKFQFYKQCKTHIMIDVFINQSVKIKNLPHHIVKLAEEFRPKIILFFL